MIQEILIDQDNSLQLLEWRAVAVKPYPGTDLGAFPLHDHDCPYRGETSCQSRSEDSYCGGFLGYAGVAVVRCGEPNK